MLIMDTLRFIDLQPEYLSPWVILTLIYCFVLHLHCKYTIYSFCYVLLAAVFILHPSHIASNFLLLSQIAFWCLQLPPIASYFLPLFAIARYIPSYISLIASCFNSPVHFVLNGINSIWSDFDVGWFISLDQCYFVSIGSQR